MPKSGFNLQMADASIRRSPQNQILLRWRASVTHCYINHTNWVNCLSICAMITVAKLYHLHSYRYNTFCFTATVI